MTQSGKAGNPRETKQSARERVAEERRAQAAAQARRDKLFRGGLIALVLVLVVGIGLAVVFTRKTTAVTSGARPAGVTADGGIPTGTATKPVVDLYEDFQCPVCKEYETAIGTDVQGAATSGKAKVVYHILSFLDGNLNNDSSARSANAAGCAQDQGTFLAFHNEVYKNQPATEGAGYTDEQLVAFGKTAGVPDMTKFTACVKNQTFKDWVVSVQAAGNAVPVTGTPTFIVDGVKVDFSAAKVVTDLRAIFLKAIGQG